MAQGTQSLPARQIGIRGLYCSANAKRGTQDPPGDKAKQAPELSPLRGPQICLSLRHRLRAGYTRRGEVLVSGYSSVD